MEPIQLKMGRTAVGLSLKELAELADVSTSVIARYEGEGRDILARSRDRLQKALADRGVVFIPADGSGGLGVSWKGASPEPAPILSPLQLKVARVALDLTVVDFAALAGVAPSTITGFGNRGVAMLPSKLAQVKQAFEDRGIAFMSGGQGVRFTA